MSPLAAKPGTGLPAGPAVIEPGVLAVGSSSPRDPGGPAVSASCVACGYDLSGLGAGAAPRCPECGVSGAALLGRLASAAGTLAMGTLLLPLGPIGLVISAWGWHRLAEPWPLDRARRGLGVTRPTLRASAGLMAAAAAGSAGLIVWIFGLGRAVSGDAADEALAAGSVGVLALVWAAAHGAGCLWGVIVCERAGVRGAAGLLGLSGVGGPTVLIGGVLLIGVGVAASHLALYPPGCLLLPLWAGAVAAWWAVTAVAFSRLRAGLAERAGAIRAGGSPPVASRPGGIGP